LRGLSKGVSWVQFSAAKNEEDCFWVSSGMELLKYNLSAEIHPSQLIIDSTDTLERIYIQPNAVDDEVNEVAISPHHLAFSSDSGAIGVVDLSTLVVTMMKQKHTSVALPLQFVPTRPTELISGGYDKTLLHFDCRTGTLLSHLDLSPPIPPPELNETISLSPPFALAISISSIGVIACATASGDVYIGYGGSKTSNSTKRKKARNWKGLKSDESIWFKAAEGAVVGVGFDPEDPSRLFTLSLNGTVGCYSIPTETILNMSVLCVWTMESRRIAKATTMVVRGSRLLSCGVGRDRKGYIEILNLPYKAQENE